MLPRNLHFEAKPLRSLAPVTKSRLWTTKTMAGALDTYPRRDLAEYFLNIPIYFQLYLKNIL